MFFNDFINSMSRRSWRVLGGFGASWGGLGSVLEPLGAVLGRLGAVLEASWGDLGASWGGPGAPKSIKKQTPDWILKNLVFL